MRYFLFLTTLILSCNQVLSQEPANKSADELAIQVLEEGITSLDPVAILAWVEMERSTSIGKIVTLHITVENGRDQDIFELESIDLAGNLGKGFEVISIKPKPTATDAIFGELSLEYPLYIEPGEEIRFELELLAKNAGIFIGEVDIWEGDKVLTRVAQCKVVK